jgi:protein-L-isoaspartate O-methyltransferase
MKTFGINKSYQKINDYQEQMYGDYEKDTANFLMDQYSTLLEKFKEKDVVKILDIGGASGYFASALSNYFCEKKCEVFVVDSTKYDTWGGDLVTVIR